jgi:hypothetical protein
MTILLHGSGPKGDQTNGCPWSHKIVIPNRSAAQWRDLRFLFPVLTRPLNPDLFSIIYGPTKVAPLYETEFSALARTSNLI